MSTSSATAPATQQSANVGWAWLLLSSVFEITFALSTEATDGFTKLWPSLLTAAAASVGIFTLSKALKSVDVGVGYTVWAGIGAVGTVVFGTIIYDEPMTVWKVISFLLIIGGALGLRISDTVAEKKKAAAEAAAAPAPVERPQRATVSV
ncbi:DMT family transporter [Streptomyces sp. BI20]|uniref:DMT family transporter n=1 Tax=Streptomyces sp. BI20 TaxID=3403460 RepID=UPI003C71BBCD